MNVEWIHAALRLWLNLTLIGGGLAAVVACAFRLLPTTWPRVRYVIAVLAFFGAIVVSVAITTLALRPAMTEAVVAGSDAAARTTAEMVPPSFALHPNAIVDLLAAHPAGNWLVWGWGALTVVLLLRELGGHWRLWRARRT